MPTTANDTYLAKLRKAGELLAAGRVSDAGPIVDALCKSHPGRHETRHIRGLHAAASGRRAEAMRQFEKAVELAPDNALYWQNLGAAYRDLDLLEFSLPAFGRALKLDDSLFESLHNAGTLFRLTGRAETGLKYLDAAIQSNPRHERAQLAKGISLKSLGRDSEAEAHYRRAIRQVTSPAHIYVRLAGMREYDKNDPIRAELVRELARPGLSGAARYALHLALGKVSDDAGDYDAAIENCLLAGKHHDRGFDMAAHVRRIDRLIATFTAQYFVARKDTGKPDDRPVFIVGMPESGAKQAERIVAGCPSAFAAGELSRIDRIAGLMGYRIGEGEKYFGSLATARAEDFANLAAHYLQLCDFLAPKAKRIADGSPLNFLHLGLIALLLPNARIVHCTRNPIDTCVSIFMSDFGETHSHSGDLATLGLYYREYRRLMDHWKKVLPMPIFEMSYEETTLDFEGQARRLIDFIGLPWDAACLQFGENKSTVRTLGSRQVRQPVHMTSVGRWRRYEKHLGPLIGALGGLADVREAKTSG
jgi:tetratricopeptide (TPR) repeat protein